MIGQAQHRLQPRQFPGAVAGLQAFEHLRPILFPELEIQALRTGRIGWLARIVMGKQRAAMAVVRADQPQHQFGIMRMGESPAAEAKAPALATTAAVCAESETG